MCFRYNVLLQATPTCFKEHPTPFLMVHHLVHPLPHSRKLREFKQLIRGHTDEKQ